jgi:conjugal transfer mating pair stabilization protein TraG
MLNQSYAASYRSGSFQQADGRADLITTNDGQQILNISSSNLPISLNVAETQSAQLSEQSNRSYQQAIHQSESFANSMAATLRQGVELSDHLANSKQSSDSFNDSKTIEQTKALNRSAQVVKDFAKENNLTTTQAAQVLAAASLGEGKGLSILKTLPVLKMLNFDLKTDISGGANLQDIYSKAEKITQNEDFQSSLRQAHQLTHNQVFSQHNDQGKRLVDSMARSWDEANSFRKEANKNFSEAQSYQQQAAEVKNTAATINANYTQEFVDWLALQKADHTSGHIGTRGAAYIIANNSALVHSYAQQFVAAKNLLPKVHPDLEKLSPQNLHSAYHQEQQHEFMEVNQNDAEINMNTLRQKVIDNGLITVNDHGLEKTFNEQQTQVQQQLTISQQNMTQEYNNSSLQHKERSKKNLTGQALQQGAKQVVSLITDPILAVSKLPSGAKDLIKD